MTDRAIERIVVLSYYHPWIAGGGHRPHQIALEDLRRGREVCFLFRSEAEAEVIAARLRAPVYARLALFRLPEDSGSGLQPCSPHAERILAEISDGTDLLGRWSPAYVRSHNPVDAFLPLLKEAARLGIPHVYDVMDDWRAFARQPWGGAEIEDVYLDHATAVTAVGRRLLPRAGERPARLIPNGVGLDFIDALAHTPRSEHAPGRAKRVLYMGAMWPDWFDWSLVRTLVESLPDHEFTFVGPTAASTDEDDGRDTGAVAADVGSRPNVTMVAEVAHDELIAFLVAADVAIIPFVVNQVTAACSPLKVFEYLAASVPVVSTALPELVGYPQVAVASAAEDFCRLVRAADRGLLSSAEFEEVRRFTANSSWRRRVDELDETVRPLIGRGSREEAQARQ